MKMRYKKCVFQYFLLTTWISICYGCQMEGVTPWFLPVTTTVLDTHSGSFFNRATTSIVGINSVTYGEGLNAGPYVQVTHSNSVFDITTNDAYRSYEENETAQSMTFTVVFGCTGGSTATLVFIIDVEDTNNNPPQFLPNDVFEFNLTPPLPPGYQITGCLNDITVRDIDLTTQRIDFVIEPNEYFEIDYDASLSTDPKEFKAILRTTTLIRTLSEPVELKINATDVDLTGDSPITTTATIRITGDSFQFPEEPVFSQPYYLSTYADNQVILEEPITLQQGYHELVQFRLEGDYSRNFDLQTNGSQLSLIVREPLPTELFREGQILLAVRAEREFTSGAAATVVVQLPEARELGFESSTYIGTVEENNLALTPIIMSVGFGDDVSFSLSGDYATYFNVSNVQNQISIIQSTPLSQDIITSEDFMILTLSASGDLTETTSAVVVIKIVKPDINTPVFSQNIYVGSYSGSGVEIGTISLIQGFDSTVSFRLDGEHAQYFEIINSENNNVIVTLASSIPGDLIFNEKVVLIDIFAEKTLTVGANAIIAITFPADLTELTVMKFAQNTYIGSVENNSFTLENITLENGFRNGTEFILSGEYASYFTFASSENVVTVSMFDAIPVEVIQTNRYIVLELEAQRDQAVSVVTSIVIDLVLPDVVQPSFGQDYYMGIYTTSSGLQFEQEITLIQGYDDTVTFALEGDSSEWFSLSTNGNSATLQLNGSIPSEVVDGNYQLLFAIVARKVGVEPGRAVMFIELPKAIDQVILRFEQNSYVGRIENGELQSPAMTLLGENTEQLQLTVSGEYASYFTLLRQSNNVILQLNGTLPIETEDRQFIILNIEASHPNTTAGYTTVVLEIAKDPVIVRPMFEQAYYVGQYSEQDGLLFEHNLRLIDGFDESISFTLEGDDAQWFEIIHGENESFSLTLNFNGTLPVEERSQLIFSVSAKKVNISPGRATIMVILSDYPKRAQLQFSHTFYKGTIENGNLTMEAIILDGYSDDTSISIVGGKVPIEKGTVSNQGESLIIQLLSPLPNDVIDSNSVLIFTLDARVSTTTTHATVIIELPKNEVSSLAFDEAYYVGSYSESSGFLFNSHIILTNGYEETVRLNLEGDNAEWFNITNSGNSITLQLVAPIPQEIVFSKRQLIFVIMAENSGNVPVRASIIIELLDENAEDLIFLAFESRNYVGSIENNTPIIEPINLYMGYSENVEFTISGDLSDYFNIISQEALVTIHLEREIPEELLPTNGITLLELQASAPDAISGYTMVIFEFVQQKNTYPIFSRDYYTGSYSLSDGFVFHETIVLTEGYNDDVEFNLEGEGTQWFGLQRDGNNVLIVLTNPIPNEVLESNQQIFLVLSADKPGTAAARATVVIWLLSESENWTMLRFERNSYLGSIENNLITLEQIRLSKGYTANVSFTLNGDEAEYFELISAEEVVTVLLRKNISEEDTPIDRIIILELEASAPLAYFAYSTIILEIVQENIETVIIQVVFSEQFYTGSYSEAAGLIFNSNITLDEGYDGTVEFGLEGDSSIWFGLDTAENAAFLILSSPIPPAVLVNNQQLIFTVTASKPGAAAARATIVVSLTDDFTEPDLLGFNKISYIGSIENNEVNLEQVILSEGYTENITFTLHGDLAALFNLSHENGAITIILESAIPAESIPENQILILEIQASAPQSISAFASMIFEIIQDVKVVEELFFSEVYYNGSYNVNTGLVIASIPLIQGYDENVSFSLEGEQSQWFGLQASENNITLTLDSLIPPAVLLNNQQLVFVITAQKTGTAPAKATIIISLTDETTLLGFNKLSYLGSIENNQINLEQIILSEGYNENVSFLLRGESASLFSLNSEGGVVTIMLLSSIPPENLPASSIIVLEIKASEPQSISAFATIVFEILQDSSVEDLVFSEVYYTGEYTVEEGLVFEGFIILSQGFDDTVEFLLEGENSQWFSIVESGNSVTLAVSIISIPQEILDNYRDLIFVIVAEKSGSPTARAVIIISLLSADGETLPEISFQRALYAGVIQAGRVQHEAITLSGYNGTELQIFGTYAELFVASSSEGSVTVEGVSSVTLAPSVVYVALQLHASSAATVLLLDVEHGGADLPTVSFSSTSYSLRTDVTQNGFLGRVEATASNGEALSYSLLTQNDHLKQRISVNREGEIHLSAPADSGVYSFVVVATTDFSDVSGTAVVQLRVDVLTICGDDQLVIPPLIILERDEEEPHRSLVIINEDHVGCRYSLTNRWPVNQTWLYVDDTGLHANAIDREDRSIAFMALSQVQVELLLECDSDNVNTTTRSKRSVTSRTDLDHLGPYDYGDSTWILTDAILYNSRRTLVNLIVNDINDNYPIFVGKENEPIAVGYPIPELEERVSPRALIKLEATDADVGENAALVYWSLEEVLAVSPSSGLVHVRQNANLQDGAALSVLATDRSGHGLTGNLTLLVKLLDVSNIAVVTVKNAFLEDEQAILEDLSISTGYEVKALRADVVSDSATERASRRKRDVTTYGASLQIYVYGLIEREPVHVDRLTADLTNDGIATANITRTVSLEDHLEEMRDSSARDTGLLVATIVLSVLLFILIVAAAVWYFLKWRKERNYDRFKDENSIASLDVSQGDVQKPQTGTLSRLNIDELKRSERRLQERLQAPVEEVTVEPSSLKREPSLPSSTESSLNTHMLEAPPPIVIQDKLKADADDSEDDDEFGERQTVRRKSVVTFNENVEKIIHVEQTSDDDSSNLEVYKL